MFVDIKEKTRIKYCLRSLDGEPWELSHKYATEGYDMVSFVSKQTYIDEGEGIISSCLYKIGNPDSTDGEYSILGVGMTSAPDIPSDWENMIKTSSGKAAEAIRQIHMLNGYAILCNTSENKNTPEQVLRLEGLDAIEVCNGEAEGFDTPASLCNALCESGVIVNPIASGSEFFGSACVEAKEAEAQSIVRALKAGRFYSSEGDSEIHIYSLPSGKVKVDCSPASEIRFFTNKSSNDGVVIYGENLVCAEYVPADGEKFIRAQLIDMQGLGAWSTYIEV